MIEQVENVMMSKTLGMLPALFKKLVISTRTLKSLFFIFFHPFDLNQICNSNYNMH